jgi:carboxymethylenebutenolidase
MPPLGQVERYLIHEFIEDYEDGLLTRRGLIRRVIGITGGVAAAATVLTGFGVKPVLVASAQEATPAPIAPQSPLSVAADDPRIAGESVSFEGNGTTLLAYQAKLADSSGPLPLVLVCHENRGLTEHIRDVARRWAVEGYLAVAVDLLSREGGTDSLADPADAPGLLTNGVDMQRHVDDFRATLDHYLGLAGVVDADRIGMQGFCFGGGVTWRAAEQFTELKAAAPFYGPAPPLDQVPNITAAVLGVYSDDPSDFASEGLDELEAALEAAGVTFEIKIYPGTQHAFHNDTGARYNEEQALAAWNDTVTWFRQYALGGELMTPVASPYPPA